MKKLLLTVSLSIIFIFKSYSQITFERGYFINESDQRIECLIKNKDWLSNPTEFQYKISPNDDAKKATILTIKEFGIDGVSKFVRDSVEIDRSSDKPDQLSQDRNPIFQKEQLFLKTLVEGEASLFIYFGKDITRFFYQINGSKIKQLIYKPYVRIYEGNSVLASGSYKPTIRVMAYNNYFRQQLLQELACQSISEKDLTNIDYSQGNLRRFFVKYNKCSNHSYKDYNSAARKNPFQLTFRPALNSNSLEIRDSQLDARSIDFGSDMSLQFGIEAEVVLPFNKNKWSIIVEPTYQGFNSEKSKQTSNVSGGVIVSKISYQSIEFPIGFRHYFFLNKESKIFANISWCFNSPMDSDIKYFRDDGSMLHEIEIVQPTKNFALGFGYKFKNRYNLELRYHLNRNLLRDYYYTNSNYKGLNLIFGLTVL